MSWSNIDLKSVSTEFELVPEGKYTLELSSGAKYNDNGTILASATIVSEGEFAGKRVMFSYPDPESTSSKGKVQTWSAVAFKRLTQALGVDINDGEDQVAYLNRVAGNRFTGGIKHHEDDSGTKRANLQILNVSAAA